MVRLEDAILEMDDETAERLLSADDETFWEVLYSEDS